MAKDVEDLLASLTKMIQDSLTLPLGKDRCVIDKDRALAILDEIAILMPGYLREAKRIAEEKVQILTAARRDAEATKRSAEEHAKRLVSEQEILIIAKQRAMDITNQADTKSRELRRATNEYVDNTLRRTEEAVTAALNELRQSRIDFRAALKK